MNITSTLLRNTRTAARFAPYGQICRFVSGALKGRHCVHGGQALILLEDGSIFIPDPMGHMGGDQDIFSDFIAVCKSVHIECEYIRFA